MKVIRDGSEQWILEKFIVCGDIIYAFEGMRVPCDGVILSEESTICTNEGGKNITKGSVKRCEDLIKSKGKNVPKDLLTPILLNGTEVIEGSGKFIAIAVGSNRSTEFKA